MSQVDISYTLSKSTELGFAEAVTRVREELAETAGEVRRRLSAVVERAAGT
jgi:hypothetical protein